MNRQKALNIPNIETDTNRLIDFFIHLSDSVFDIALTIITLGIISAIYFSIAPALFQWSFFLTGSIYLILLIQRIVHKFYSPYSVNDVCERLEEMDTDIKQRLDKISRNIL